MLVETYEVEGTDKETGVPVLEPDHLQLIETLDLPGQRELIRSRTNQDGDEVQTLCPFREITAEENAIYGTLLSRKMGIKDYNRGLIPFRVLALAALAQREEWFTGLQIWCPANESDRDPLLVGYVGNEYSGKVFILARWGEVLEDLETLRVKAIARWKDDRLAKLTTRITEATRMKDQIASDCLDYFNGRYVQAIY